MQSSPFESLNVQKYQTAAGKFYRIRLGDIRIIFEFDPKTNNQ
jgi:mRNA-degrading endonuclease RelE of RelBE toxin-antitoxin system